MKRINLKIIQCKLNLKNKMEIDTVTLYQLNMTIFYYILFFFILNYNIILYTLIVTISRRMKGNS